MGFLSGGRRGGSTKKPKGKERDKCGSAKHVQSEEVHKQHRKDRSTCESSECGETKSSSGVAKIDILCLRLSWGLDAHGCRLLQRRDVVPWWQWGFVHHQQTRYRHVMREDEMQEILTV